MVGTICRLCLELGFPSEINSHPDYNSRYSHAGKHLMHDWSCLPGSGTKRRQLELYDTCFLPPAPPKKAIQKRSFEKAFPEEQMREKSLDEEQPCSSKRSLRVLPKKYYEEPDTDEDEEEEETPPENIQISVAEIEEDLAMTHENSVAVYKEKQIKKEVEDDVHMEEAAKIEESTAAKADKPIKKEILEALPAEGKNAPTEELAKIEKGLPELKNIGQRWSRIGLECNLCKTRLTINTEVAQWEHLSGCHLQTTPLFHCGLTSCGWTSHRVSHMRDHIRYTHKKTLKRFEANEDVKKALDICFNQKRISSDKCRECGFECSEELVRRRREKWVHVAKVHIKQKIIFCNSCKEGFDWVTNAQVHLQKEHPNVKYDEKAFEDRSGWFESVYIRCFGISGLKKAMKSEQSEEKKEVVEVEKAKEKDETGNPGKSRGIVKLGTQQMMKPSSLGIPLSNRASRIYHCNKGCKEQFSSQEQLNRHRDGLLCTKKRVKSHPTSK